MNSRLMARVAAPVLFAGCAAIEITRVVIRRPWLGFNAVDSNVVGLALATLWLASAVVLATGTRKALYVVIVGSFALLAHGVVTRAGGSTLGLVYLGLAPLVVLLERVALGSKLVWGRTAEEPTRAEHARTSV